jgi:hypothetical protein
MQIKTVSSHCMPGKGAEKKTPEDAEKLLCTTEGQVKCTAT